VAEKEKESRGYNYLAAAAFAFVFVGIVSLIWPKALPFPFWSEWELKKPIFEAVWVSWPLFVWAVVINTLLVFTKYNGYKNPPHEIFIAGTLVSLWAGIVEEICFRWVIFLSAIVSVQIVDFLFLGFIGLHPVQWFYMAVLCPVANFFTLGMLAPYLSGQQFGWAAAAAIISSNGHFRDGHAYQGIFGWVHAWFVGMYMFWLVFNYGLLAAIIVHCLFDFLVYLTITVDAELERRFARS